MKTQVSKWGHSLAVRIPRAFADQLGVREGSPIEISVGNETVVLKKLEAPRYTLNGLLSGVTPENLHGEVETGRPVGREEW